MPDIHLQRCPCPRCHSLRTIQTDATWTTETLCCPECEHNDSVICDAVAAELWKRRERRIRLLMMRSVLEMELEDILGVPTPG